MLIAKSVKKGDELPYRIEIGSLSGMGISPARAVMAALSVGKEIPTGLRNSEEAAEHIYKERVDGNYHDSSDWVEVIRILNENNFGEK